MQKTLAVLLFASLGTGCWMYSQLDDTMTQDGVPLSFHAIMVLKVTDSVNLIKILGQNGIKTSSKSPSRPWPDRA